MSDRDSWETPQHIYDRLCAAAGLTPRLDVASTPANSKCPDRCIDGLTEEWHSNWWCNPPYSNIQPWVDKALAARCRGIMLLPANRTGRGWMRDILLSHKCRLVFFRGRIRFIAPDGITESSPRFDNMAVIVQGFGYSEAPMSLEAKE